MKPSRPFPRCNGSECSRCSTSPEPGRAGPGKPTASAPPTVPPGVVGVEQFESVDIEEYMQSRQMRDVLRRNLAETIRDVDVLAMPTTGMTAPEYPSDQTGRAVYDEEAIEHLCQFAFLANLTGLPAGTAPCGWVDGLPVGIQFVGDAWDEASVFAMLAGCERAGLADGRGGT